MWSKRVLAPFGPALAQALRSLADTVPADLRANATAVLKVIDS